MTLMSMTGFARADGRHGDMRFHWELRSVNGRGLDVRLRLPPGYDSVEPATREAIAKRLARGSVTATLVVDSEVEFGSVRINAPVLQLVTDAIDRLRATGDYAKPRPEGVLALRGVLEATTSQSEGGADEVARGVVVATLAVALDALVVARRTEGAKLAVAIHAALDRIESLVETIAASPSRRPEAIAERLGEQVRRLLDGNATFDRDRLHQEAVLIATRIDIEEEIKRLGAHLSSARALLEDANPAGRRLDFLAQEFNREANTICSKANDIEITRAGLELKAVIDQVREQVQNIE